MTPLGQGPVFDRVDAVLRDTRGYAAFRTGELPLADYADFLDAHREALVAAGVPSEDVDYAKRYPADIDMFVRDTLALLRERGVIAHSRFDAGLLAEARAHIGRYDHRGRTTYIYPEEASVLAALADIRRPHHALFLGSYYGYWAGAILPALKAGGGTATLVDPDPDCCALARENLADAVDAGEIAVACTTGEAFLDGADARFDMVVIDAELPRDHPQTELRGKGIYAQLLAAALPRLADGALLVCHNILLNDHSGARAFDAILERNCRELAAFDALARRHFPNWTEIASTEGMGAGTFDANSVGRGR